MFFSLFYESSTIENSPQVHNEYEPCEEKNWSYWNVMFILPIQKPYMKKIKLLNVDVVEIEV